MQTSDNKDSSKDLKKEENKEIEDNKQIEEYCFICKPSIFIKKTVNKYKMCGKHTFRHLIRRGDH